MALRQRWVVLCGYLLVSQMSDGLVLSSEMLTGIYLSGFFSPSPSLPVLPSCLSLPPRPPDFNYNTDGYEGDGAEDGKSQDGSETLPFIDESPTMSPQLCTPQGPDGVSPTPPDGLLPGVRTHALISR